MRKPRRIAFDVDEDAVAPFGFQAAQRGFEMLSIIHDEPGPSTIGSDSFQAKAQPVRL